MKVLFWNARNKKVDHLLEHMAIEGGVDLFILAEFDTENNDFLGLVNASEDLFEEIPQIGCIRINIFLRLGIASYEHGPESDYFTSKQLTIAQDFSLLLIGVHLPSKLHQSNETQTLEASEFKLEIEDAEKKFENHNTFIIGDFNMNPFEAGMVAASSFHSIPCVKIASAESRLIKGRSHKYFYNPMWNLFGDIDSNPGSYFYGSSEQTVHFWNIFDQVILRPRLTPYFIKSSLEILKSIGETSLVNKNGRPSLSDHLPIVFGFNFEEVFDDEKFMA